MNFIFPNKRLFNLSFLISLILFTLSSSRHLLLQSNAYDLGLFDQWIWLLSRGLPPYSSMAGLHIFADHGAWILYIPSIVYKFFPSIYFLLFTQSLTLSFCSIPLWSLSKLFHLNNRTCWLICILWWFQPVVFNVNLFDFHPEVWIMPFVFISYFASFTNNFKLWIICLVLILGARDGLVLLVLGMGIEQFLRKRIQWSISAIILSISWLIFLNKFLYPRLNLNNEGILAIGNHFSFLGESLLDITSNIILNPSLILNSVDVQGSLFYLVILLLPFIFFLGRKSLLYLSTCFPILMVNILAESLSFRTLIHHYSLPLVAVGTVAAIQGISKKDNSLYSYRFRSIWILLSWSLLAKPGFFLGPYLSRLDSLKPAYEAIEMVDDDSAILTTSYLVPHLSQRQLIQFPKDINLKLESFSYLLLNPYDPGWSSSTTVQNYYLNEAKAKGWFCRSWNNGQTLCSPDNNSSI